ncbi:MAG: DUF4271 domain-containing protein [bacterium]
MREILSLEIITILLTVAMFLWVAAKIISPSKFYDYIAVLNITRYLKVHAKEEQNLSSFNTLLSLSSLISFTILLFYLLNIMGYTMILSWKSMALIGLSILSYFAIKQAVERLLAFIFEIESFTLDLIFIRTTYRNYAGVIAFIGSLLLAFTALDNRIIIYVSTTLIGLLFLFSNYIFYRNNEKVIIGNIFYFILYLCALEIGPLIIISNVLSV